MACGAQSGTAGPLFVLVPMGLSICGLICLCFGGDDNDVLFITSARTRLPASTLSKANWMGRAGHVDEMVGAALFLSTQASSFMTGEVLTLSGGY